MRKRKGYDLNSPIWRRWWTEANNVHAENSEYKHCEDGSLIGVAPNAKKIREFYKKRDKFYRLKNKKR